MLKHIGIWSFLAGIVLAIIGSFVPGTQFSGAFTIAMAGLGVIVGLLNIEEHEIIKFLIASIVLVTSSGHLANIYKEIPILNAVLPQFFTYLVVFVGASAAIVALKEFYLLAKD